MEKKNLATLHIELADDYYGEGVKKYPMYKKAKIDIHEGITILVGCNGSGKSCMLQQIKDKYEDTDTFSVIYFTNENAKNDSIDESIFRGNMDNLDLVSRRLTSSEGENINISLEKLTTQLGRTVRSLSKDDTLLILIDAIDSGLSIDYIEDIKRLFTDLILPDCQAKNINTYVIISANNYAMVEGMPCLSVTEGKYISFKDYEEYKEFILDSHEYKTLRYNEYNDNLV